MSRMRSDQGFTIIEVLVAAVILITVIAATSALFIRGNDASLASQRQSQAISVADEEIELVRQDVKTKGFDALAMTALPSTGSSSSLNAIALGNTYTDPNHFVTSSQTGCGSSSAGSSSADSSTNWRSTRARRT